MGAVQTVRNERYRGDARTAFLKEDLAPDAGKPYAGCYVNAVVDIWAQAGDYPGIRASLNVVQFYADGEPFAGSAPNVDDLPDIEDTGELEDLIG